MTKENLTKEQLIKDLTEMDKSLGLWAENLLDHGRSVKDILTAMQRMVDYIQRK